MRIDSFYYKYKSELHSFLYKKKHNWSRYLPKKREEECNNYFIKDLKDWASTFQSKIRGGLKLT